MVKIPTPEWIKELLGHAPKAEPRALHVSVPEPETEPMPDPMTAEEYEADLAADEAEVAEDVHDANEPSPETDIPADVQDEIRELAAQEAASLEEVPETAVPLEVPGEPEARESPDGMESEAEVEEQEPQEPPKEPRSPRRFEFRVEAARLKAFVAQLEHLVDEVKVHATQDGWHVLAVDPAHVAMVELRLNNLADAFERRNGVPEGIAADVEFGLGLAKLKDILRLAKKDDAVRVIVDLPIARTRTASRSRSDARRGRWPLSIRRICRTPRCPR